MDFNAENRKKFEHSVSWRKQANFQKLLFVACAVGPALAGYLLFNLYPNILSVYYSLLDWDGISEAKFVGLANFARLIHDRYLWRALAHNMILILAVTPLTALISLTLAALLTSKKYREVKIYKVLYFFPNTLPTVVVALLWSFIYSGNNGLLNGLLKLIGIDPGNFYWLGEEKLALWAVMLPIIWSMAGFYVIIFMNAMSSIPVSLYESAYLDGCGSFTRLFKITIPLIWGVVRVAILFIILGLFKGFDMILILTNGGPAGATEVMGLYMLNASGLNGSNLGGNISNPMFGYASAIGMVLFVVLIVTKQGLDKLFPSRVNEF